MTAAPHPLDDGIDPDEVVYTSLIQTYLSLLCYDNAIFLAERLAAHCPTSENAIYLLAHCYYRNGSAKRARSVLLSKATMEWNATNSNIRTNVAAGGTDIGAVGGAGIELERTRSSARYLLAKCCFDLGNYGEAEEALLKHAREQFSRCIARGEVKIRGGNRNEAMDAWIINSSVNKNDDAVSSSCPIPNGAAGLNLLGNICRRSNRRHRAMEYYRLSLKLDPLMWTSYEALCELGGAEGSNAEEADDPKSIFGVDAPLLSPRGGDGAIMGTQHNFLPTGRNVSANNAAAAAATATPGQQSLHSFKLNRYGTPSTPYSTFDQMKIDTGTNSQLHTEAKQAVNNLHQPATTSTIASRTRSRIELPQTKLFDSSVATTAQKATPMTTTIDETAPKDSAIGYANEVLDRARRVVAGMTYEPSPESKSPSNLRFSKSRKSVGFADTSNISVPHATTATTGDDLTFSQTPLPGTPHDAPAPFHAAVSSVKGEKRALFTTIDGGTAKRKSPKKKDTKVDDDFAVRAVSEMTPVGERIDGATNLLDGETENHHVGKVLQLLCCYGAAYKYLCQNRSQDALELFRELPLAQINTGWVQHQIGRAYFEMTDYQNAQRALENMQKIDPHRIKGLDILSTTYWQLKKEVELSDLAQKAVDFDKMAPEAWFVVGNCFSLQKEHETAITFFSRSIQLDPTYTYAYTLCGHEYTSNEDFEKAISCYRDAIRVDNRHYNAWYGLGAIYFRQEKFDLAEYHFQRALEINSQSSVLHCHLGMAQHQNGKTVEALETLAGAFRLDPRNPQAHYQRATIFMSMDRADDALAELEKVRAAAPKEASVHFNMGKVYKRMGKPERALRCFLTALDLDPKDNNLIKAAMDRLDEPDIEEEVSVF